MKETETDRQTQNRKPTHLNKNPKVLLIAVDFVIPWKVSGERQLDLERRTRDGLHV